MFYFDNAATTFPKPEEVHNFMNTFYRDFGVNVSRGQYKEASMSANLVRETRDLMLNLFNANANYEVVFTPSATISMNTILFGQTWKAGEIVYITKFEHNAVLRTLNKIAEDYKIIIKYLEPDKNTLKYDLKTIKTQISQDKPKMVILNHASNSFGFIFPIKEVSEIAHQYGAKTVVDMSQTAGLIQVNIDSNIDYLIFAGHKTLYAPLGIAGFLINKNDNLKPFIYGGTGIDSSNLSMPKPIPERLEAGSPNIMAIAGLNASMKWINKIGIENIYKKEKENFNKLFDILNKYLNIKTFIHPNLEQVGIISSVFDGYPCENIGIILSEQDIAVRTGLHCAPDSHRFMNTFPTGTVRFSISYFTNSNDLEHLDNVLEYISDNS
ncbi:MAG: aminotransferase class V-fold PLP-dependent enzyme [Cyanobacteria bacterium SIG32]|nr:aminotransferase class V-fold PLP-dependent enzyme [Cyanobacteria bacterium SIG32]